MMNQQLKELISKELEQLHCSILLDEVKEKVRRLRGYGVNDAEIEAALHEDDVLPPLKITRDFRIVLCRNREVEIRMEPLVKAVFLLFLQHPEGIVLKHLPDHRKELMRLYARLRPYEPTLRVKKSIEDVTNPMLNSINEKCTRIRKAFLGVVPENTAKYYFITGQRGEAKKILLPRELVEWEEEI